MLLINEANRAVKELNFHMFLLHNRPLRGVVA
jgi:hypothetical protein